ncbi:hypothetical protein QC823_13870 [Halomonas vilamensis]|uniref:Phosphotyrosine protein phosphatase I domain-containing protein n=1 Tax=Vreelandella vilamensis TaxID=531309 RepID=A0ABU1H6Y6_9GAMM|nr:hypothetical protein [Halomonas vilamensis]MDR5900068.1 hypothetical protein [Halomonas vilamensis]
MNILFLCMRNACRSQMAEGVLRHLAGDRMGVDSAGIETHGKNPRALQGMEEIMQQFRVVRDDIRAQVESLTSDEMDGGQA